MDAGDPYGLVDHLFRREAGRMVASLTRSFGPGRLDLAADVVQEALIQALKRWPFAGVPHNPRAWLYRVAKNLAVDRLRRDATFSGKEAEIRETLAPAEAGGEPAGEGVFFAGEVSDDQLRLIFLCCHPEIPRDARVALTLKTVLGFGVGEIARAFLAREATVAQRLVRAQRRIREREIPFEVPGPAELPGRVQAVLEVLYLLFNEGYGAHQGGALVRSDLCTEALRLAAQLADLEPTAGPAVHALSALLCFQASRLPARLDGDGNLVLLGDQDRALWDRALIRRGFAHFERAAGGEELTTYHLEAAIAAHHAAAASDGETDWRSILAFYDELLARNPSPVVALNRAVAVARLSGPAAGLAVLAEIEDHPALCGYYLLPATRAELLACTGERAAAAEDHPQAVAAEFRRQLAGGVAGPRVVVGDDADPPAAHPDDRPRPVDDDVAGRGGPGRGRGGEEGRGREAEDREPDAGQGLTAHRDSSRLSGADPDGVSERSHSRSCCSCSALRSSPSSSCQVWAPFPPANRRPNHPSASS